MTGDSDPKLIVDIGLGARASLEARVSTEIPPQSSGRLLDAITDIFRPFSERRGLKADQIRLQREDVLIEIAKKAQTRLLIENQQALPLPNKFLVPFLEKASLEEVDSELIDRWTDLLVSCSINPPSAHPRFVQILSELTAKEAQLLRNIILNNIDALIDYYSELQDPSYAYQPDRIINIIRRIIRHHLKAPSDLESIGATICKHVHDFLRKPGIEEVEILVALHGSIPYLDLTHAPINPAADDSRFGVLQSLDLIRVNNAVVTDDDRFDLIRVSYVTLTSLGVTFLRKCDRDVEQRLRSSPGGWRLPRV